MMKKRSLKYVFDRVYWHILCLLPFIAYLVTFFAYQLTDAQSTLPSFENFLHNQILTIANGNIVFDTLQKVFGPDGILPLFEYSSPVLWYAAYVVNISILRLAVEFLTFLPDLAHHWKEKLLRGE